MIRKRDLPLTAPEPRSFIARLVKVDEVAGKSSARTVYEFDAFDLAVPPDQVEAVLKAKDLFAPFSLIRVRTTARRFKALFGFAPSEDAWVELKVAPKADNPRPYADLAQLEEGGYLTHQTWRLTGAEFYAEPDETPGLPRDGGAAASTTGMTKAQLVAWCNALDLHCLSAHQIMGTAHSFSTVASVLVRDVGQAGFATLLDDGGTPVQHFDAGWPISYNRKTVPDFSNPPVLGASASVPVILSHWDWDHLHGFYIWPQLRQVPWIVPKQQRGPGGARITWQLYSAQPHGLLFTFPVGGLALAGTVIKCAKAPYRDKNDSGYALFLTLASGKSVLLPADASYDALGAGPWQQGCDFMAVTHHGGKFTGDVPPASGAKQAAVSVGAGNGYGHPDPQAIAEHRRAGWQVALTAADGAALRGDKVLGP